MTYDETESRRLAWLALFFILSVILHLLSIGTFVVVSGFFPPSALPKVNHQPMKITILSEDPTRQRLPQLQPHNHTSFAETDPSQAPPNPNAPFISDNNSILRSEEAARKPDSVLPDVQGKVDHPFEMKSRPNSPTQKQEAVPAQTQPEQPKPQTAPQVAKTQPPDKPQNQLQPRPSVEKTTPPTKPVVQQYTPDGLPVLPPINAQTLAPLLPPGPNQLKPQVAKSSQATPPHSLAVDKSDTSGGSTELGPDSVAANATELGRYQAKVYRAISSYWHHKTDDLNIHSNLPIGTVVIQYTVYADGHVETTVLQDDPRLTLLRGISLEAITEPQPYDPFTESMKRDIGNSYTDVIPFTVY